MKIELWEDFLARQQQKNELIEWQRQEFFRKFKGIAIAIAIYDEPRPNIHKLDTTEKILTWLEDQEMPYAEIETEKELWQALENSHNDILGIKSLKDFEKREQDAIRQELEAQASAIASKYGCNVNSLQFLDACEAELEHFSNYREGMREDGLCLGWGVTVEQWYQESNASHQDSDAIARIIQWVKENLPLLYGQWQYNCSNSEIN